MDVDGYYENIQENEFANFYSHLMRQTLVLCILLVFLNLIEKIEIHMRFLF